MHRAHSLITRMDLSIPPMCAPFSHMCIVAGNTFYVVVECQIRCQFFSMKESMSIHVEDINHDGDIFIILKMGGGRGTFSIFCFGGEVLTILPLSNGSGVP